MSTDVELTCNKCGVDLREEDTIYTIPYCRACAPSTCPECGCQDIGYSSVRRGFMCDNGCGPIRP